VFSAEPGEANGPGVGPAPAVRWKGRDAAKIELRKHTDLCEMPERGWTELICAAERCEEDKVRRLLNKGADVNAVARDGGTALMEAAGGGRYPPTPRDWPLPKSLDDCAKLVKEGTYKPDFGRQEFLETLSTERRNRRARVVKLLLDAGADVHKRDNGGWTALMCAAKSGLSEVIRALVERGAEVNASNHQGDTPLILAAKKGHTDVAKALIAAGANVNAKTNDKDYELVMAYVTPLMAATISGSTEIAKALIEAKADVNAKDKFGNSIVKYSINHSRPEIFSLLKAAGAEDAKNIEESSVRTAQLQYRNLDETSYTWLWIVLIVLALGGGGAAGYFFWWKKRGAQQAS